MRVMVYQGVRGGWHWRFLAKNNRAIAVGCESYPTKASALRAFKTAQSSMRRFGFYGITELAVRPRKRRQKGR